MFSPLVAFLQRWSQMERQVLALDRVAFNTLLGSLEDIIRAQEDGKSRRNPEL